jgi:hypothetical protein
MPKMYGKIKHTWFNSCRRGCCDTDISKTTIKREELAQAMKDAEEEMSDDSDS